MKIKCKNCKKKSLEYLKKEQGYTLDNRQYSVGSCCCCDRDLKVLDEETDVELMMEFRNNHWGKWVLHCLEQGYQPEIFEGEETKEVIIGGKRFHFEVDYDDSARVTAVRLTECGDPNATEMLEAYDLEPIE